VEVLPLPLFSQNISVAFHSMPGIQEGGRGETMLPWFFMEAIVL